MIQIQEDTLPDGSKQYSIINGSNCSASAYYWHLYNGITDIIVSNNNIYINTTPNTGDKVWVRVRKYSYTYWNGGEFYGGDFRGNFGGGTFHYGQLNDCFYLKQEIKSKPFTEDINKQTGPQSVKLS